MADGPTNPIDPANPRIQVNPAPPIGAGNAQLQRVGNASGQATGVMVGWQTMFPPPDFVRGYGDAVPDGSERFFRQFELEAEHRRQMDRDRLGAQASQLKLVRDERRLSQAFAGMYAIGALILAGFLAEKGYPGYATAVATTSIASVVAAFLAFGNQTAAPRAQAASAPPPPAPPARTDAPPAADNAEG